LTRERPTPADPRDARLDALDRIEQHKQRKVRLREERITLAHGAGGKATQTLVEAVFLDAFRNPHLERLEDQAIVQPFKAGGERADGRLAFTTDGYVVSPLFFPGGDIGDLAVNGTVNDLAVSGARPLHLSAAFILEEGFLIDDLRRIAASMAQAAANACVTIVAGDTKVVERGKGDGCFITTAGIGVLERDDVLGAEYARPGDAVIVSGAVAEHGVTILLARGHLDIQADVESDTAPLHGLIAGLLDAVPGQVRCLRDATRGGVATVLNEIASAAKVGVQLREADIPVREPVNAACELLGIDPLHMANEGRLVAIVAPEAADRALDALRRHPLGREARLCGHVTAEPEGLVLLQTHFGGQRVLDVLIGDPLPRIC
jgi:hydrogenase expression/formation protein HypE